MKGANIVNQQLFELYSLVVVDILASSLLAWELGTKGVRGVLRETNERGRPSGRVLWAFGLLAISVIWQRWDQLKPPYQSWRDAWPVLIAVGFYLVARNLRPTRLKRFLKAKQVYEDYMRRNVASEPNAADRSKARNDSGLATAESLYREAIDVSAKEGQIYDVAVASFQLGMLLDLQGRDDEAMESFKAAIELTPKLRRDPNMIGTMSGCYYRMGLIFKRRRDINNARSFLGEALALDEEVNDAHGQRICKEALDSLR